MNKSELLNNQIKQEEDNILSELKPVKFEGLYKKEMNSEEIKNEIQKLLNECLVPQTNEKQSNPKFGRQAVNNNLPDYTYPFKEDKISCTIF